MVDLAVHSDTAPTPNRIPLDPFCTSNATACASSEIAKNNSAQEKSYTKHIAPSGVFCLSRDVAPHTMATTLKHDKACRSVATGVVVIDGKAKTTLITKKSEKKPMPKLSR